jgi:porin
MDGDSRWMLRIALMAGCALSLATQAAHAEDCLPPEPTWWDSPYMSGDLFGARSGLAEHGVIADLQLTQFYQGVTHGGVDERFRYGGKGDYYFTFLGEPLGLNKGFTAVVHAETRFGQDSNFDAVALSPVNINMLYPSQDAETAVTGVQIMQALNEDYVVTFGKINALDLFNTLYPQTGRGVDGFMNTSTFLPLSLARTTPLSFLGAGVLKMHSATQIEGGFMVYDNQNIPTTSGFDDMFNNGASVVGFWRFFTEMNSQPGSHMFMGMWSEGTYTSLDPTGWEFVPGVGPIAPQDTGTWSATYILEQQLWADSANPTRNIGLMSQWSLADAETSPYQWVANVSLQGRGLITERPNDTAGVAYFYNGLSNEFEDLVDPLFPISDVHGAEIYYNAEITKWFHLTADLQAVQPALDDHNPALIVGVRGKIDL